MWTNGASYSGHSKCCYQEVVSFANYTSNALASIQSNAAGAASGSCSASHIIDSSLQMNGHRLLPSAPAKTQCRVPQRFYHICSSPTPTPMSLFTSTIVGGKGKD